MVRNKASTSSGSPNVASSIKNCFKASPNGQTLKSPPRSPTHGSTNNFANFSPPRSEPKPFKSLFKTDSVLNQVKTEKTMSSVTEKARNPPNGFVKQSEKQKINGDCKVEVKKFQNGVIDFKKLKQSPKKEAEMNGEQHLTSRIQAQPASYRKLCGVFKEGHDVLVRWSDGLYYLGTVFKVDDFAHRCYVQFEDKSMFWAQFKDLQMINNKDGSDNGVDSDVTCSICHDGVSDPPNEIVLCDKCGQGYHQLCHIPAIDTSILN
uniref:Tudor domain-containing protein n=1 Tax=Ciona savignyi TaxID=51511 RepID=H2Y8K3_CIOSA